MVNVHQFAVGDIACTILHDGSNPLLLDGLVQRYPDVTPSAIQAALGGAVGSESHINCLLIETSGQRILVDTGFGEQHRPQMGQVVAGLAHLGISSEQIDTVFLTHFHGDHILGLLTRDGTPTYPNANYITNRAEWKAWMPKWKANNDPQYEQMAPLAKRFTLVEDGAELAPGVTVTAAPGHTPGHSGLLIASNGERLLHLVDTLHQVFQFEHTAWQFRFDSDGALAVETRQNMLTRAAKDNLLTLFYHLPFPGLGKVEKVGSAFRWQSLR